MNDFKLGDTLDFKFTTRAFATGVPTTLSGTPVIQIYEDNSITQISAGITLTADFDGVTGLNNLRIVATSGNGFETGKSYACVISTGTVGGVSVVGEVVQQFSLERSPAFARIGAPAGASIAADLANMPTVAEFNARTLLAASYFDPATDTVANVTNVTTVTTLTNLPAITANWLTPSGIAANALTASKIAAGAFNGKGDWNIGKTGYSISGTKTTLDALNDIAATAIVSAGAINTLAGAVSNVDLVDTCTSNTDMRGTEGANTTAPLTAAGVRTAVGLATANLDTQFGDVSTQASVDAVKVDTAAVLIDTADMQPKLGTPTGASVSADIAAVKADTAAVLVDTSTTLDGLIKDVPTVAEFNARTKLAAEYFDPATDAVANVTNVATATNLTNAPTAGDLTTAMKASVNAEVVDTLNVDTYAEPGQGTPAATSSLAAKLNYIFKAWRNRSNQTATTYQLFNDDAVTVDQKATVSDNGTTAEKGEVATGP